MTRSEVDLQSLLLTLSNVGVRIRVRLGNKCLFFLTKSSCWSSSSNLPFDIYVQVLIPFYTTFRFFVHFSMILLRQKSAQAVISLSPELSFSSLGTMSILMLQCLPYFGFIFTCLKYYITLDLFTNT